MATALDTTNTYKFTDNVLQSGEIITKETKLGGNYSQIIIDDINPENEKYDGEFKALSTTLANTLYNLLLNSVNGESNYLSFTLHGESVTKYWTASNVKKRPLRSGKFRITCTFIRRYPAVI